MNSPQRPSGSTKAAEQPAPKPADGATAAPPAAAASPAAAPVPEWQPTGADPDDLPADPTTEEAAMTSALSDPDHVCTMFCDCPAANFVAGGTAALRTPPPSGTGPSSVREAVNRAADAHRSARKYGKR